MNKFLAAAAILLASATAASAQTIIPCLDNDPTADTSGACAAAPTTGVPDQSSSGTAGQGTFGIDPNATSAIPEPSPPQGMGPLVVPNDPLGLGIDQNPFGSLSTGTPSGINGNGAISSPAIR
jgi:hypothetical protein